MVRPPPRTHSTSTIQPTAGACMHHLDRGAPLKPHTPARDMPCTWVNRAFSSSHRPPVVAREYPTIVIKNFLAMQPKTNRIDHSIRQTTTTLTINDLTINPLIYMSQSNKTPQESSQHKSRNTLYLYMIEYPTPIGASVALARHQTST